MNNVLNRIGVTTQITEIKRLGKFSNTRKKPWTLPLTLPNEYDARLVLAKAYEKRTVPTERGVFILPYLSKENAIKENLCLRKRSELREENVPRDKLKIRNLELFNDGKKVDLGDNHEGWRLGIINILLINTRRLASLERRSNFANAVTINDYIILCA